MKANYLLKTKGAEALYEVARDLPIIDFHNHLSLSDISSDRQFDNIYDLWLASDPYKHRLMRISGIPEHFITGDASPYEKFEKYADVFPFLAGNPVYDWARMELSFIFGVDVPLCHENARKIYDLTSEMLKSPEFSNNAILKKFGIEYNSPVATLFDSLSDYNGKSLAPSLRADDLLTPDDKLFATLTKRTGVKITDERSYINAISVILDEFAKKGCRFADHSLDYDFFENDKEGKKKNLLTMLGNEYAKRKWTLLLHLGAKRQTSSRLRSVAGAAGGYAAVGGGFDIPRVVDLLNGMECSGGLPDTVLFPLNMSDQAAFSVMQGSFSEDGVASKVQLGPAWWWCDNILGIENTLNCISSFGLVSRFIGMTTDSRSILSFVRHDYFRRLACSWLDEISTRNDWELSDKTLEEFIKKICYRNAKEKIKI